MPICSVTTIENFNYSFAAYFQDSNSIRRGIHQYSMAGVPPIGPITSTHNKTSGIMNIDLNNNNSNDGKMGLNRFNPLPPISKIPGLNPDSEAIAAAEKKIFRTFKIQETDSSYVKLAKQGGHKNLLEYKEFDKENFGFNKRLAKFNKKKLQKPDWLEYEAQKTTSPANSPTADDVNNNNSMNNNNNNKNRSNNNNNGTGGAGKSIIEIKKQAKMMKERPDLLPVDNTEILKHLNAPKRPVLPKIGQKSRLTSRFVRVAGR